MQLMITKYGGKIISIKNHVAIQHSLCIKSSGIMPLKEGEIVNSYHDFGIDQKHVKDFLVVATSQDGFVEAIAHKKYRMWGIMWHPERPPFNKTNLTLLKNFFQ